MVSFAQMDNVSYRDPDEAVYDEFLSKRLRGEYIDVETEIENTSQQPTSDVIISNVDMDGNLIVEVERVVEDTKTDDSDKCCECRDCSCSCHVNDEMCSPDLERPIDSYVVYLFDYELFNVPKNYNKFEILYDYLNEERIFDRSYVVSVATDTRRDDFSMYERGNRNLIDSKLERSDIDSSVLRYRPSIVESVDETRNDVRQRFRGLVVQGSRHDWFTVKSVLNYPSFVVYVRVLNSKNDLSAVDHTIIVDPSHKTFISSPGTHGLKIARILAHTRTKYFGIQPFNFSNLLEQANLRIINRAASRKVV